MRGFRYCALAVLSAACALNPAPVPVVGDSWSISDLAGEWEGEYRGPQRTGSILFTLEAGRDTAFGDVVMAPRLSFGARTDATPVPYPVQDRPRTLFIRFVRVENDRVSGVMDPYPSPDCECLLSTAFTGTRRGDRITGTYVTQHRECDMPPERGTWWAERKHPKF